MYFTSLTAFRLIPIWVLIYDLIFSNENNSYIKSLMTTHFSYGAYRMVRQWILNNFHISPVEIGQIVYDMSLSSWEIPALEDTSAA